MVATGKTIGIGNDGVSTNGGERGRDYESRSRQRSGAAFGFALRPAWAGCSEVTRGARGVRFRVPRPCGGGGVPCRGSGL